MNDQLSICASTVTYRTPPDQLMALLHSIFSELRAVDRNLQMNVVVVVNDDLGDADRAVVECVESLATEAPPGCSIAVVRGHGNVGYSAGQNKAILDSCADFHLILNPDVELTSGCLTECLTYLVENPRAVAVVPQGFDSSGGYAWLAKRQPSIGVLLLRAFSVPPSQSFFGRIIGRYVYADMLPSRSCVEVENASGCFMLVRGLPLRRIGGFDERFFLYFEDYDLSQRLHAYGTIVELPKARIVHHGGRTAARGIRRIATFCVSGVKFFRKHGWRLW